MGRRDFLTRLFRSPSRTTPAIAEGGADRWGDGSRRTGDASTGRNARRSARWREDARTDRDFTAPECGPESLGGESNLLRVLKEINDWTGIEDP